jgi:hypothetical protein
MVSKMPKLRGKGEAYGPWQNGQQTVYRVYAVEAAGLYVSVLGTRAEGEAFRPQEHEPLSPPFLIAHGRTVSVYMYPTPGLSSHPPWPRLAPAEPRPYG